MKHKGILDSLLTKLSHPSACVCVCLCCFLGGDVVKVAQLASQSRIAQTETPVTLQFQGNKFTLSPSQLRQLTTGQPLQLQGTVTICPLVFLFLLSTPSTYRGIKRHCSAFLPPGALGGRTNQTFPLYNDSMALFVQLRRTEGGFIYLIL